MAVAEQSLKPNVAALQGKSRSPWSDAWRSLLHNRAATIAGAFIILLTLLALLADYINPYTLQGFSAELARTNQPAYAKQTLQDNNAPPGALSKNPNLEGFVYVLGADQLGRDLLTRTLYGTRISLAVAVVAATVSLVIGLTYGLISGYAGGRIDELMMRIVDFLYGLPIIIVVILMQVYFKAVARRGDATGFVGFILDINQALGGLLFVFIAIGALNWIGMARIARGQTLAYKEKEFVEAARAIGDRPHHILFRHLLPNILGPCIVQETLQIPGYILTEAFLSFIGLGVDAPTPSWGIMLNEGYQSIRSSPHITFVPAVALTLTVLAFNFLGDGLRDAFDPRQRSE
ncbi:ABC transporter permease [Litorilinea aerophila]|uniref:ABC transporter permease n=1 Tax=Litorilinea aerophila TaxID=1204385 RepID=UPI001B883F43|nr:ABC transporter permease [Litorilinea aerophila]MCC9074747.1 ABC transporter permease [Litorilinea aerophila]